MADFGMKVQGLDRLRAALGQVSPRLREHAAEGLGRAAERVAAATQQDTPVRTSRAKAGLKGLDGKVTSTGAMAAIVSTGTPSAFFHASEKEILEHDAVEEASQAISDALQQAIAEALR